MKICFVIYSLSSGGAERAVTGLANFWSQKHDVTIITLVESKPFYPLENSVNLYYCFKGVKGTTNIYSSILDGFKRIKSLIALVKQADSDVVLSFMLTSNIYAIWAAKWLSIPCVISERSNHNIHRIPKILEIIRNFSYKYANTLVVQTNGNRSYYDSILKKVSKKIIPNAVALDLKYYRDLDKNKEKIILNVGSFKNGKAQDILIKAFAKIKPNNWRIVFLGDGPNLEKYEMLATELGVADKISFKGALKDVASFYNIASLFVFTSEHEGFPNALLEALYFGIPSISTNCAHGPADMITDGENGFLVPVGNVNALAQKMELLMNSLDLQEKFRENALKSTQKFEMEPIAAQWMELIQKVVD